jgi:hypothetical protein
MHALIFHGHSHAPNLPSLPDAQTTSSLVCHNAEVVEVHNMVAAVGNAGHERKVWDLLPFLFKLFALNLY